MSIYRDDLLHLVQVRERALVSLQEAQAMLLRRLHEWKPALAIERCGTMQWPCGQRLCPACSSRWHRKHRGRLDDAFDQMSKPSALLLKVFSNTMSVTSLKTALKLPSRGWLVLKRRAVMKGVSFAGILEVAPIRIGGRWVWCVHVHGIAELPDDFDLVAAERAWREITGKRNGTLGAEPIRSRAGYVQYISKMRDRCPTPGALPHGWVLKVLSRGMRNEHAWFEWGLLTKRGRRPYDVEDEEDVHVEGVTKTHPIWVASRRAWIEVAQLAAGDVLTVFERDRAHAGTRILESIRAPGNLEPVFDLAVEGPEHTFFADDVLVHNKSVAPPCYPDCGSPSDDADVVDGKDAGEEIDVGDA